jgi:hypothetical protein
MVKQGAGTNVIADASGNHAILIWPLIPNPVHSSSGLLGAQSELRGCADIERGSQPISARVSRQDNN